MSTEERRFEQIKRSQTDQLIRLGIPRLLGISETDYRECVPDVPPQPPGKHGKRFPTPVLVDPRLTLGQCARIGGIAERLSGTPGAFLLQVHECVGFSAQPYWIWCGVVQKGLAGAMKMTHVGSRWISATEGVYYIFAIRLDLIEMQNDFTCPGTQYTDEAGSERGCFLEKDLKSTVLTGLGLGMLLGRQQQEENPGSLFQLNPTPIRSTLVEWPSQSVYCAWPPQFDWSGVPKREEAKGWRFW
jgi:hypothetical protein